jgi:hypothetical protein
LASGINLETVSWVLMGIFVFRFLLFYLFYFLFFIFYLWVLWLYFLVAGGLREFGSAQKWWGGCGH